MKLNSGINNKNGLLLLMGAGLITGAILFQSNLSKIMPSIFSFGQSSAKLGKTPLPESAQVQLLNGQGSQLKFEKRPTLILFWASWCHSCAEEFPSLVKFLKDKAYNSNLQIYSVSIDETKDQAQSFYTLFNFNPPASERFVTLIDSGRKLRSSLHVTGVPEAFFFNGELELKKHIIGSAEWQNPEILTFINSLN